MISIRYEQRKILFTLTFVLFLLVSVFSEVEGIHEFLCQNFTLVIGDLSIQKGLVSYFRAGVLGLLLLKIVLDAFDVNKISFCQIVIFSLVVVQALISHGRGLLFLFVFALAARDIDIKTISKVLLLTLSLSICVIAFLALNGFVEEIIAGGGEWYRPVRRSLGFKNQNTLALYILSVIYACFVLFGPKMKKFIGISLIVAIGFFLSGSRGLVLGATSLFVFFYVFKTSCKTIRRSIIFLFPLIAVCYLVFLAIRIAQTSYSKYRLKQSNGKIKSIKKLKFDLKMM